MKKFIIGIVAMVASAVLGLCGCAKDCRKTVASMESMTLTLQGMRFTNVYEIVNKDGKTEIGRFRKRYAQGKDTLELEASAVCDTADFIDLLNACGVLCWDGFHGKHPKNVKDGIMFDFSAIVNGGQKIQADGSENFPEGYHTFVRELDKMLAAQEEG